MTKFLSALSKILSVGIQIFTGFAPTITTAVHSSAGVVQTISQDLGQIFNVVTDAEQIGVALQLKGPDKLKAAVPGVVDIILKSAMLANHKIADEALFQQGCTSVASGIADIINSLHTDGMGDMIIKKG